jgi:hypothetical protein
MVTEKTQSGAVAVDIGVSGKVGFVGLQECREDLGGQWCTGREDRVDGWGERLCFGWSPGRVLGCCGCESREC